MNHQQIKQKVREAFTSVDSEQFLKNKIKECLSGHKLAFETYMKQNPKSDFVSWKNKMIEGTNSYTNNHGEIMVIGIFLIALDNFETELTTVK